MKANLRTHHIGVVVGDLEKAIETYRSVFGAVEVAREDLPAQQVSVSLLDLGGGRIELISPTSADSGVSRFLQKRGEGFHHVAYEVGDIYEHLRSLRESGARLIDEAPRRGLRGHLVAFVHPESAHGVLIELVQTEEGE